MRFRPIVHINLVSFQNTDIGPNYGLKTIKLSAHIPISGNIGFAHNSATFCVYELRIPVEYFIFGPKWGMPTSLRSRSKCCKTGVTQARFNTGVTQVLHCSIVFLSNFAQLFTNVTQVLTNLQCISDFTQH